MQNLLLKTMQDVSAPELTLERLPHIVILFAHDGLCLFVPSYEPIEQVLQRLFRVLRQSSSSVGPLKRAVVGGEQAWCDLSRTDRSVGKLRLVLRLHRLATRLQKLQHSAKRAGLSSRKEFLDACQRMHTPEPQKTALRDVDQHCHVYEFAREHVVHVTQDDVAEGRFHAIRC